MKKMAFLLVIIVLFSLFPVNNVHAIELENLPKKIELFIEERKEGTSSVSLGVFQKGQILYQTQYGYIDQENKVAADNGTIYEWGSVSKVLVWISLMQLQESGQIDLTKDIKTYLDKDFASQLKYPYPISLQDIMNLQSGFQEVGLKVEYTEDESIPKLRQLLIESQPEQVFKPRTVTAYNNWTPALAAYVVESVTGQDFCDYVQEHIFSPLGMKHTAVAADWHDNVYVKDNRARSKSYYYTADSKESLGTSILHVGLYPAGASAGTFDDFLTFAMEFTKDHPRFFKNKDTFIQMKKASTYYADGLARIHHGLLSIDDKQHLIGHSGNTQAFTSAFWFDDETQIGYAVMTNEPGETAYNYGLSQLLFGSDESSNQDGSDISGLFTSQRSIHRGALRFTKYLSGILPIQRSNQDGTYKVSLADFEVKSRGNHCYYFDNKNGLVYKTVEKDQGSYLESFTTDNVRLPLWELVIAYGLVISLLVIVISMVIRIIARLIARIKGKRRKITLGFISHIASTLVSIAFIYLWMFCSTYSRSLLCVIAGICVLSSLVVIAIFCRSLYHKLKGNDVPMLSVTWPMIIPFFVYFYQLYNFWS